MADHMTDLATQFEALARAATQGEVAIQAHDRPYPNDVRIADGGRIAVAVLPRCLYRGDAPSHAELTASDHNAAFIAFCFNHRALIAAALRGEEDGWMQIDDMARNGRTWLVGCPGELIDGYAGSVGFASWSLWKNCWWFGNARDHFAPTHYMPSLLPPSPGAGGE